MVEFGLIRPEERVELLNGAIVRKMWQKPSHSTATTLVADALRAVFGAGASIRVQMPIALSLRSEPEPDVLVGRGSARDYARAHPTPGEALLIVEVADSSIVEDRRDKVPMYLAEGVPEVWLLDLPHRRLLRYRSEGDELLIPAVFAEGDALPAPFGGDLRVADLLP